MKRCMIFGCWFLFLCSISFSSSLLACNTILLDKLTVMYEKDQKTRFEVMASGGLSSAENVGKIEAIDQKNLPCLKSIIHQFG